MPSNMPTTMTAEGICNMALGHLKILRQIALLSTDLSAEGQALRLFYDNCKTQMFEDFKWPGSTTQGALSLVEENPFPVNADNDSEWAFAYQYPSDAVNFVRILGGVRNESRQDRIPFRIVCSDQNPALKMILTDMDQAIGEWTTNSVPEDGMTASQVMALSLKLAYTISPMVTGGDPFKLGDRAFKLYDIQLKQAQGNALNEEQAEEDPESEFVLGRDYRPSPNRFDNGSR